MKANRNKLDKSRRGPGTRNQKEHLEPSKGAARGDAPGRVPTLNPAPCSGLSDPHYNVDQGNDERADPNKEADQNIEGGYTTRSFP